MLWKWTKSFWTNKKKLTWNTSIIKGHEVISQIIYKPNYNQYDWFIIEKTKIIFKKKNNTLTLTPVYSVKNASNSNGVSASCRRNSSESLHNGSNVLRSHELPAISWWLFPVALTASSKLAKKQKIEAKMKYKKKTKIKFIRNWIA